MENISHIGAEVTRHDASQHDTSRYDATAASATTHIATHAHETADESMELRSRIDVLDKENLQLKIDRAAKEQVIGQMLDDRKRKPVPTVDGVSFQATRASTAPLQFQGRSSPSLEARCPHASWSMA